MLELLFGAVRFVVVGLFHLLSRLDIVWELFTEVVVEKIFFRTKRRRTS